MRVPSAKFYYWLYFHNAGKSLYFSISRSQILIAVKCLLRQRYDTCATSTKAALTMSPVWSLPKLIGSFFPTIVWKSRKMNIDIWRVFEGWYIYRFTHRILSISVGALPSLATYIIHASPSLPLLAGEQVLSLARARSSLQYRPRPKLSPVYREQSWSSQYWKKDISSIGVGPTFTASLPRVAWACRISVNKYASAAVSAGSVIYWQADYLQLPASFPPYPGLAHRLLYFRFSLTPHRFSFLIISLKPAYAHFHVKFQSYTLFDIVMLTRRSLLASLLCYWYWTAQL